MPILEPFWARTLVEDDLANAETDRLENKHDRFNDIYRALTWRLARNPKDGVPVQSGYWVIRSANWTVAGIPQIEILYSFDDDHVYVHAIREI